MHQGTKTLFLISLILLASCAEQPTRRAEPGGGDISVVDSTLPIPEETTEFTALLQRAADLLQQRQLLPAASILRDLDGSKLSRDERARALLLRTELLYLEGDSATALSGLQQQMPLLQPIEARLAWQLQRWQMRLLKGDAGPLAAAGYADGLLQSAGATEETELVKFIWLNLNRCSQQSLEEAMQLASDSDWRAWLELALLATEIGASPGQQQAALQRWRERNASHPANRALPGGLELLAQSASSVPARIALLLPLSVGPVDQARAVLEGFLAARYAASRQGWPAQQLLVMDIGDSPDINSAYDRAVAAGAQLVFGPLTRDSMIDWQPRAGKPVPLLAFDWLTPPPLPGDTPVYQLALSPADEAAQAAQLAFDAGARHALVIRPQGSWGERASDALLQRWTALEGTITATAIYSGQTDYSSSIKAALNLSESEQRARQIRRIMGTTVEFSPRRRRDVDTIFLLSDNPADARSIKPLIAFHYAGDLPVYATSEIFSGRIDPRRDQDLNDIRLVATPWTLSPPGDLPNAIAAAGGDPLLANWHALGADAFLMHWRLEQLAAQGSLFRGYSGLLGMDAERRFHRELIPALMRAGVPEAM